MSDIVLAELQFRQRVRDELEAFTRSSFEDDGLIIQQSIIDEYIGLIVQKSIRDENFLSIIDEIGYPATWEDDCIRDFIQEHSDWFTRFSESTPKILKE